MTTTSETAQRDCATCERKNVMVTVTMDGHDPVDILGALQKACDPWALKVVAQAILQDTAGGRS